MKVLNYFKKVFTVIAVILSFSLLCLVAELSLAQSATFPPTSSSDSYIDPLTGERVTDVYYYDEEEEEEKLIARIRYRLDGDVTRTIFANNVGIPPRRYWSNASGTYKMDGLKDDNETVIETTYYDTSTGMAMTTDFFDDDGLLYKRNTYGPNNGREPWPFPIVSTQYFTPGTNEVIRQENYNDQGQISSIEFTVPNISSQFVAEFDYVNDQVTILKDGVDILQLEASSTSKVFVDQQSGEIGVGIIDKNTRISRVSYYDASTGEWTRTVEYWRGRLWRTKYDDRVEYYNKNGEVNLISYHDSSGKMTKTERFYYTETGNIVGHLSWDYVSGVFVAESFNPKDGTLERRWIFDQNTSEQKIELFENGLLAERTTIAGDENVKQIGVGDVTQVETFSYDENGLLTEKVTTDGDGNVIQTETFSYDEDGALAEKTTTDGEGNIIHVETYGVVDPVVEAELATKDEAMTEKTEVRDDISGEGLVEEGQQVVAE